MLLGLNAVLYRNTGTYGSPTWTAVTCVSDLKVDPSWDTVEIPTRASKIKKNGKTLLGVAITGSLKSHLTDAAYLAIIAALMSQTTVIDFMVLNAGNTDTGAHGFRGEFLVTQGGEDQGVGSGIKTDITFVPADTDNAFSTVLVTAGAPVFTTV